MSSIYFGRLVRNFSSSMADATSHERRPLLGQIQDASVVDNSQGLVGTSDASQYTIELEETSSVRLSLILGSVWVCLGIHCR